MYRQRIFKFSHNEFAISAEKNEDMKTQMYIALFVLFAVFTGFVIGVVYLCIRLYTVERTAEVYIERRTERRREENRRVWQLNAQERAELDYRYEQLALRHEQERLELSRRFRERTEQRRRDRLRELELRDSFV